MRYPLLSQYLAHGFFDNLPTATGTFFHKIHGLFLIITSLYRKNDNPGGIEINGCAIAGFKVGVAGEEGLEGGS